MYVGVLCLVFGQALLFASVALLAYGAALWIAFHEFVVGYEEPNLRTRFGAAYDDYRREGGRWLPRLRITRPGPASPGRR